MTETSELSHAPKVVVVNDDLTQLNLLTGLLKREGFETFSFCRADEALAHLATHGVPDLIVTDLYMPDIDGWRFCRLLRSPEYGAFSHIPILVVSATFAGDNACRITKELGANAFLSIPVERRKFIQTVSALLRGEEPPHLSRVLIVDDSPTITSILKQAFEGHGYQTDLALTGKEALKKFAARTPDIVVLDYSLPDLQGDVLLEDFRRTNPDAVFIMMTTDPRPELALAWMKKGAAAYVRKPFEPAYLLELCSKARRERALLRVEDLLEERTRQLRQSEGELKSVFDCTPIMMCVLDSERRVLNANISFMDASGRPESECDSDRIGGSLGCVNSLDDPRGCGNGPHCQSCPLRLALADTLLTGEAHHDIEYRATVQRNGRRHQVVLLGSTARIGSTDQNRTLVCLLDITQRKRAEEERVRFEQQLQQAQKAESLARMAGAIAHQFNNLLTAVMGNLELAMIDLPQGSGLRVNITKAMTASLRAAEISRLMLAYLGQAAGKRELLDLSANCTETLPLLSASLPQKVRLKTELPAHGPIIQADAVQVKQVLTNLVVNAGEAIGDREGEIIVAITVMPAAEVRAFRSYPLDWEPQEASYACIAVSDTGAGMDPVIVEKIFDPFFSTKFTGRGLGLAVVLGLVRAHGGAVSAESEPGRSAIFRVFLPVALEETLPPRKAIVSETIGSRGLVLLVEDELMVRDVAQAMLELLGYEVIAAGDGSEAVEIFRTRKDEFRLVLSDLTMPGMDGWETLTALRAIRHDIPVVLASGHDEALVFQGDHPEQPQAFLHKPYQMADLALALGAVRKTDLLQRS
jgi:CheY-like chemotaxis protein